MNKSEANISLFIITFFASIQYIFLAGVPENLSHFAFICITNLIGFFMTLAFFFGELFRLDLKQIKQSAVISGELVLFNIFMLMGVRGIEPTVTSAVLSLYFLFVMIFESILYRRLPQKMSVLSVALIVPGLFFMMNANIRGLYDINILYMIMADIWFALYVMTVGSYASSSNPSILAMGQMFFCFIFSFILWAVECFLAGSVMRLPDSKEFWVSVIFISFFIRGLYGIIQIYAQRYVSPLSTSLIFSSEIVMTLLTSPIISKIFNIEAQPVTPLKIAGSILILLGLFIAEPRFLKVLAEKSKVLFTKIFSKSRNENSNKINLREKIILFSVSAVVYMLMDIPVRMTGILPSYAAIKNSLPFISGLFFGIYGVSGLCAGCVISSVFMGVPALEILSECGFIITIGLCMFYGWHIFSHSHRIHFKKGRHYLRYLILTLAASILCFNFENAVSFLICGTLIGLPVNVLFGSLLYVEPVLPCWCTVKDDAVFELEQGAENIDRANEILQNTAEERGINLKRIFEIQSCLEELSIRIFKVIPDAKIYARMTYYDAVSMRLIYEGKKYNPFKIGKDEDPIDIMSLKIIKHRALRASFSYSENKNKIHVVI